MSQRKLTAIIKNITREGPGILQDILDERNIPYKIYDLNNTLHFPDLDDINSLVVLGGPDSANDETEKIKSELEFIKSALKRNLPYLGICLGMQLLVKASGGNVTKCDEQEIGFKTTSGKEYYVEVVNDTLDEPVFKNLGKKFSVFHLHGETVELPENCKLIGIGNQCKNQVVKVGTNAYGLQCHFELKREMLIQWLNEDYNLLMADTDSIYTHFMKIRHEYTKVGRTIFSNFLDLIDY
jgi:GMP synthase (glutamine-hydrolysing)